MAYRRVVVDGSNIATEGRSVPSLAQLDEAVREFHGEHDWLFSQSRLVGGKPVPGVGWIFTPRTPVRGPRSRVATQDAKRTRVRIGSKEASQPMPVPAAPPPGRGRRDGGPKESVEAAGAVR